MHIVGSQVQAQAQHAFLHSEQHTTLRRTLPAAANPAAIVKTKPASAGGNDDAVDTYDKQLSLLKALVEALTGKPIRTLHINTAPPPAPDLPASLGNGANASRVQRTEIVQVSEAEITQVTFSGHFSTADGQQLSLNLQYTLQRSYAATNVTTSVGNPKDPLVLNFDGSGAKLNPKPTLFDLNADGSNETLPTLARGSAYLALDRNGDGNITNGSELFGPASGDGFGELSKLDSDGNGFIDASDTDFSKLFLFRPGEHLQSLASRDVGAIFLGSVASPARLTDSKNQSLGQLRASSFYLTNQGSAGLVQQLDVNA